MGVMLIVGEKPPTIGTNLGPMSDPLGEGGWEDPQAMMVVTLPPYHGSGHNGFGICAGSYPVKSF